MFHSFKDCTTRIEELDDEAYLQDGMPFPSEVLGADDESSGNR